MARRWLGDGAGGFSPMGQVVFVLSIEAAGLIALSLEMSERLDNE